MGSECWPSGRPPTPSSCCGPCGEPSTTISIETELETELMAALARWRSTLAGREEAGKVIAVLAPSGGSGSSTLAVNLATVLAKAAQDGPAHRPQARDRTTWPPCSTSSRPIPWPTSVLTSTRMDRVLFERSLDPPRQRGPSPGAHPPISDDSTTVTPEGVHAGILNLAAPSSPTCWSTSTTTSAPSRSTRCSRPTLSSGIPARLRLAAQCPPDHGTPGAPGHRTRPPAAGRQSLRPAQGGALRQGRGGPGA